MKEKGKKSALIYRLVWVAALCSVLTMGTMSQFVARSHSANLARVAKYVFDVEMKSGTAVVDLSDLKGKIEKPGDECNFEVTVKNSTPTAVSEVSQRYTVTVSAKGSMPLNFKMTEGENVRLQGKVSEGNLEAKETYSAELKSGEKDEDEYIFTVYWPEENNDIRYANGTAVGKITLAFNSEQVD